MRAVCTPPTRLMASCESPEAQSCSKSHTATSPQHLLRVSDSRSEEHSWQGPWMERPWGRPNPPGLHALVNLKPSDDHGSAGSFGMSDAAWPSRDSTGCHLPWAAQHSVSATASTY